MEIKVLGKGLDYAFIQHKINEFFNYIFLSEIRKEIFELAETSLGYYSFSKSGKKSDH